MSLEEDKKVQVGTIGDTVPTSGDLRDPAIVTRATPTIVDGDVSGQHKGKEKEGIDPDREGNLKPGPTARVILPGTQGDDTLGVDSEEEDADGQKGVEVEADDSNFLSDFPDDTSELELLHSRIGSLANLHLPRFAGYLRKLCLRQNVISHLDPEVFHQLTLLEELDLYDNKIKHVGDALDKLQKLTVLDLSFNLLRAVPDRLEHLPILDTVYFVQNKISKITGLDHLAMLRSLELGGNRIRKIEGLDALVNLEELWLGKNKITKLEGLGNLRKLKILSLQSNRITKLENLGALTELDQLYLSHNGLGRLEGLEHNTQLTTLDVGNNFIPVIENISHLINLEELWMSGNKIPDLHPLDPQLRNIKTLRTLYLEANPCQTSDRAGYRRKIMLAVPQLTQIDATYVRAS